MATSIDVAVAVTWAVGGAAIGVGALLLLLAWSIGGTGEFHPVGAELGALAITMVLGGLALLLAGATAATYQRDQAREVNA